MIISKKKYPSDNMIIGNKAMGLIWLEKNDIPTPQFDIITLNDLIINFDSVVAEILKHFKNDEQDLIDHVFAQITWDEKMITKNFSDLNHLFHQSVSFRTSASLEDLADHSFAGLYETYLHIPFTKENFKTYSKKCFRSIFTSRISHYMKSHVINTDAMDFSIIIQKMFPANFSGVAFFQNIHHAKIVFNEGLGNMIVDGGNAFEITISPMSPVITPSILKKQGYDRSFQDLLSHLKKITYLKESGQDIEWSLSDTDIAILQVRNITKDISLDTQEEILDNTNISESYPSIVSPLTFSFIQFAYSKVYANFFQLIGVKKGIIDTQVDILNNLLGYAHGRVYYKILNWYKMIKILPGYSYNKEFFEAMLVPQKKLPDPNEPKNEMRLSLLFKNTPLLIKFFYKLLFYKKIHQNFFSKFEKKYSEHKKTDLHTMNSREICNYYISLKNAFLDDWKVPILNDFRLMIFHGILKKMIFAHITHEPQSYLNRIVANFSTNDDLQLIQELHSLAKIVLKEADLSTLFHENEARFIYAQILGSHSIPLKQFKIAFDQYLQKFGDRRPDELILESPRISDEPEMLIDLIKYYANSDAINDHNENLDDHLEDLTILIRKEHGLLYGSIYAQVFRFVAHFTRLSIRFREKFRIKRAIVYGVARDCFLALADKFISAKIINSREDIFFLSIHEIIAIANLHSLETNYIEIINLRKKIFEEYKNEDDLPQRLKIFGIGPSAQIIDDCDPEPANDQYHGLPTSHGVIRGEAVVLKKFDATIDVRGKIVITYQTDPGWSLIFPLIKGIVLEKGNSLSHAAILSRELGIPSVVRVKGIVKKIRSGDQVEINGNTGVIKVMHI